MSLVLIGSRAAKLRVGNAFWRSPLDFDFVATQAEADAWVAANYDAVGGKRVYTEKAGKKVIIEGSTMVEFDIIQPGSSDELLVELVEEDAKTVETSFGLLPGIDCLHTIKASHRYKKFNQTGYPAFWKTMIDFHSMKRLGAKVRPEYEAFLKLREAETYNYAHPKLNVKKDEFFQSDGIEYQYDHDDLHKSVMLYDRPAYEHYLADGEEVKCSKEKFFSVSEEIRMAGALEEGLTLAIERSKVPYQDTWSDDYAFRFAIAKVATSITSGWFRQYVSDNIFAVIKLYEQTSKNYWQKFQSDLSKGLIKPFNGSRY